MKKSAFAAFAFMALIATSNINAQPGGPNGHVPRPGGPQLAGGPARGSAGRGLEPITTIQGKIVKTSSNDDFVYDGFYILNGSDSLLVKFAPHLGKQIYALGKVGSSVTVSGTFENPHFGVKEVRLLSVSANGKTITDVPSATLPSPTEEKYVDGKGAVSSMQMDREGRVNGLILDNKTLIRIPPQVSAQLGTTLAKGTSIAYTGSQKTDKTGEMPLDDYKVVRCRTITVNGQQYLVR